MLLNEVYLLRVMDLVLRSHQETNSSAEIRIARLEILPHILHIRAYTLIYVRRIQGVPQSYRI